MTAATDYQHYAVNLRKSNNPTAKLVLKILNKGVNSDVLCERAAILKTWCPVTPDLETENRILSYTIDAMTSIGNVVENIFRSAPSVYKQEKCSGCVGREYAYALIAPNHRIIQKEGFGLLEKALEFHECIFNVTCRNQNCNGVYRLHSIASFHLFIELDIRSTTQTGIALNGLKCKLTQLPMELRLRQSDEMYIEYRLAGVVAFEGEHFTAHCRRTSGAWEWYNDIWRKKEKWPSEQGIEPHLVIYVRAME